MSVFLCQRRMSLFLLATVLCAASTTLAGGGPPIHVTCRDGETMALIQRGNHRSQAPLCDVDRTCDGVCTFSYYASCFACYAGVRVPPPDTCSPDTECDPDLGFPPCPSPDPVYAIALRNGKPRTKVRRVGGGSKRAPSAFVLRCRPAKTGCTTTTTLPTSVNLTDDWTLSIQSIEDGCPSGFAAATIPNATPGDHPIAILETASGVFSCNDKLAPANVAKSDSEVTLDLRTDDPRSTQFCPNIEPTGCYSVSNHVSGHLPPSNGAIDITGVATFSPLVGGRRNRRFARSCPRRV